MRTWTSEPSETKAMIDRQRQQREAEAKNQTCPFCYEDTAEVTIGYPESALMFCRSCKQPYIKTKRGTIIS